VDWSNIIMALIGLVSGGGLMGLLTLKQKRKMGDVEVFLGNIEALKNIIEQLQLENKRKDELLTQYGKNREDHARRYEEKAEESAKLKTLMCVHLGCSLRDPLLGQGGDWMEQHRDDISLGVDYTPINVLMSRLGKKRKTENESEAEA